MYVVRVQFYRMINNFSDNVPLHAMCFVLLINVGNSIKLIDSYSVKLLRCESIWSRGFISSPVNLNGRWLMVDVLNVW